MRILQREDPALGILMYQRRGDVERGGLLEKSKEDWVRI